MRSLADALAEILGTLRSRQPLIHHITNFVAMNDVANVTLCLGALPIMAHAPEEVANVVRQAQALALNMGTPTRDRLDSMAIAAREANAARVPIILDPVGAGASPWRTAMAWQLLKGVQVTIIRANRGEVAALLGDERRVRGVEAIGPSQDAEALACELSSRTGAIVAITGARDLMTDGSRLMAVDNGHPLLATVSGGGCMATACVACCAAVAEDPLMGAAAGLVIMGLAEERAATQARGPGSFKVALMDVLAALTPDDVHAGARCSILSGG